MTPEAVLGFWFSERVVPLHFQKSEDFDQEVREQFLGAYQAACDGAYDDWQHTAQGCLALIILFDQFPRNIFRGDSQSFATDKRACRIAKAAIDNGLDAQLNANQRVFLYMPFMHSEALAEQDYAVELYTALGKEINLKFAIAHRDIVARFDRFPHRNATLGRESTAEETAFLQQPGSSF